MRETPLTWTLVIPVKVLVYAKSRLSGLSGPERAALALAMAADTVAAALACPAVGAVVVVTNDESAQFELAALGAVIVPDQPDAGLNAALRHGSEYAADRWPERGRAALAADLPALTWPDLAAALGAAAAQPHSFVADAAKTGTTLYAAAPAAPFQPMFGGESAERHRAAGAIELDVPPGSGLRRDVDTVADLRAAAGIGLGPRSAALAAGFRAANLTGPARPGRAEPRRATRNRAGQAGTAPGKPEPRRASRYRSAGA